LTVNSSKAHLPNIHNNSMSRPMITKNDSNYSVHKGGHMFESNTNEDIFRSGEQQSSIMIPEDPMSPRETDVLDLINKV